MKEDKELEKMCKELSDYLFHNTNKYNPYTKVIITNSNIEVVEVIKGIPVKRYGEGE